MQTLTVRAVMTAAPETIDAGASTAEAVAKMDELGVRHLPVMAMGRLVGVISERDLRRTRAFLDAAPGVLGPNVGDLCARELVSVGPEDAIEDAAQVMADHKVGTVVVVDQGAPVGILTCVDMCRCVVALVERLREAQ